MTLSSATTGQRIRWHRRRQGKSQAVLAGLAGINTEYLGQIERGHRTPSLTTLSALAAALQVSAQDLLSESTSAETPRTDIATDLFRVLAAPTHTATAPPLHELRATITQLWNQWQNAPDRYTRTLPGIPSLIEQAIAVLHPSTPALQAICDAYFLLRTVARRIGRDDLALLAAERSLHTARLAADPLRTGAAHWNYAHALLALGEPEAAEGVARTAIDQAPATVGPVIGALWLAASVAAARCNHPWRARSYLDDHATPIAAVSGETNSAWTVFGPANVHLHRMSIELEAGNARDALRIADNIDPTSLASRERAFTFTIDLARCHRHARDHTATLASLHRAHRIAPQDLARDPVATRMLDELLTKSGPEQRQRARRLAGQIRAIPPESAT